MPRTLCTKALSYRHRVARSPKVTLSCWKGPTTGHVNDETLGCLAMDCPELVSLVLRNAMRVTDTGLEASTILVEPFFFPQTAEN